MKCVTKMMKLAVIAGMVAPGVSVATNGMNLEGYGPIATGMGGASMAYDNGVAAVMNNPATLGLMGEGHRVDAALGFLGPNITTNAEKSSSNAFYMPAAGWIKKTGQFAYGVGMFAQGGMGTQYRNGVAVPGLQERSEVGVGRLIAPLSYNATDKLTVAGSVDLVWAGMDLQMAMNGATFNNMMGAGLISGSMMAPFGSTLAGMGANLDYGYFDFSNNNRFTGEARATGYAGKLGLLYKASDKLTIGLAYHSKTQLSDLESSSAKMKMGLDNGMTPELSGKIAIKDFQWPETYGIGAAFQADSRLLLAADIKIIRWAEVMKNFNMSFTAENNAGPFAVFNGTVLDATLPQNWKDQTVVSLGASYRLTDPLIVRFGYNHASNPIPASTIHYLFPATVQNHVTLGFGYNASQSGKVNFSVARALGADTVNSQSGMTTTHSQTNWQLMYSYLY